MKRSRLKLSKSSRHWKQTSSYEPVESPAVKMSPRPQADNQSSSALPSTITTTTATTSSSSSSSSSPHSHQSSLSSTSQDTDQDPSNITHSDTEDVDHDGIKTMQSPLDTMEDEFWIQASLQIAEGGSEKPGIPKKQASLLSYMSFRSPSNKLPASSGTKQQATLPVAKKPAKNIRTKDDSAATMKTKQQPGNRKTCPFYKWIPGDSLTVAKINYCYIYSNFRHSIHCGCFSVWLHPRLPLLFSYPFPCRPLCWPQEKLPPCNLLQSG